MVVVITEPVVAKERIATGAEEIMICVADWFNCFVKWRKNKEKSNYYIRYPNNLSSLLISE